MKKFYTLWLFAVTLIAVTVSCVLSMVEENRLVMESKRRAMTLLIGIEDPLIESLRSKRPARIARMVERLRRDQGILGIAICPTKNQRYNGFPKGFGLEELCKNPKVQESITDAQELHWSNTLAFKKIQYTVYPAQKNLAIVMAQDLSYLRPHWIEAFVRIFLISWSSALGLLALVAGQSRYWLKSQLKVVHHALRSVAAGRKPRIPTDLHPLSKDIHQLAMKIRTLTVPSTGIRRKDYSWLDSLKRCMDGRNLIVVSNREPYIHQKSQDRIEVVRPASGLVTALEPILRQCGGLWIAHGSGSADRDVVNAMDEVQVPPGRTRYTLKRVWLNQEEESGYYFGFSNEGLWPLCHLAHTRPTFRLSDWEVYRQVNQRFTDAIPKSALDNQSLILVQDYHFALLPKMLRQRRSSGPRIGLFWHIPWPNPEAFGICPWNQSLLRGMLGSDVIGFHTQYHCNNFLETCNRYLEARIDLENFSVTMENHETLIRAFPIGIDTPHVQTLTDTERKELKARYGITSEFVAVGVDRLDYTKGLVERIESVERFLEKNPEYVGRFALAQMGSPSRAQIGAYRSLHEQLEKTVNRVNERFTDETRFPGYRPIVLLAKHHEWEEIKYFYQLGDVCMVTSLHDGMNLVAKEYVWCQDPKRGSLILSKFTGASRELSDALVVNPYSIEEMADAIGVALSMPAEEKARRMRSMRDKVENNNAYHWASNLVQSLIPRVDKPELRVVSERKFG